MAIDELSADQAEALAGTQDATTGVTYPANGLQPYYLWLIQTLSKLAAASAGTLRVVKDDASATTARVMPGRASISGTALDYAGGTLDLGPYNNDTVYVWLYDDGNGGAVDTAAAGTGWPSGGHIKLAEVTVSAGAITDVLDRRFETMLKA